MHRYFLFFLLFFSPSYFFTQTTGTITDGSTDIGLPGVKIICSDGSKAISRSNGEFSLDIKKYPVWVKINYSEFIPDSLFLTKDSTLKWKLNPIIQTINTVVISSSRRKQAIEEVPISMEVIKPALIDNKGLANLEQVVDQSPGVYAMDGQVSIRGGGGYAYGAGSRVMLLWNGVPMLSPDIGDAKWNAIPMEQTDQIEIIKGASSVLYGSGALNGIISLSEKEANPKNELKVKFQSGIYDNPKRKSMQWWKKNPMFYLADVYHSKAFKNWGYTVGTNFYLDSGFRQGEQEKRLRFNGSFYYKPKDIKNFKAGLSYNFQYQDAGVFVLWKNDSMGYQAMDNTLSRQKAIRLNLDPYIKYYDKNNNKHFFRNRYYLVTTGNDQNYYDASFAQMIYSDYQFQKKIDEDKNLTLGIMNNSSFIRSWVFGNHQSQNNAFYGQFEGKFWKKFDWTAGMRIEYYKLDTMIADSRFQIGNSFDIPVYPIFRTGAHYTINKFSHLRASIGQGIRFPSIAERFVSTSVGGLVIFKNPNLRPEKGWSGEIGWKQLVKMGEWKGAVDAAVFINEYSNMTEFTFGAYNPVTGDKLNWLGAGPASPEDSAVWNSLISQGLSINNLIGFQAQNAERARITGLELSFNSSGKIKQVDITSLIGYTYLNPITLNVNQNYTETFSDTTTRMLKYRFRHMFKADLQVSYKKFSAGISCRYNSHMKNIDKIFENSIGGTEILPGLKEYREIYNKGALVFDTRIMFEAYKNLKVNLVTNNIFNNEYVSRPGDIQAPRNFIIQLQYEIK
jgi:outer membrane cobalamin receptor